MACKVEVNAGCREMLTTWFDICCFGDIKKLITHKIPANKLLDPGRIKFVKSSHCYKHERERPVNFHPGSTDEFSVMGSPCVLFSTRLGPSLRIDQFLNVPLD